MKTSVRSAVRTIQHRFREVCERAPARAGGLSIVAPSLRCEPRVRRWENDLSDERSRIEALLEPTLTSAASGISIYSTRACFFVAFLGGPFAILLFSALNSRRLGRLARDSWIYVLGGIGVALFVILMGQAVAAGAPPEALGWLGEGRRGVRNASRLLALALFGFVFLAHRPFHRAAQLHGPDAPSPWVPGIAATVLGAALSVALVAAAVEASGE